MKWLIFVTVAVLFASATLFTDNYISDFYFKGRGAAAQKLFYSIAQPIIGLMLIVIFGLDLQSVSVWTVLTFLGSGALSSLAGIFYYKALEADDSTNVGIFVQLAPVLYLVLGWIFLGEEISFRQLVAFIVILAAPLLIVITTQKRSRKVKFRAMGYAFLYVLVAVISNLVFVQGDAARGEATLVFGTEMGLMFIGKGFGNATIMLMRPKWCKRFWRVLAESRRKVLRPLFTSFICGVVKESTYRAALIAAPSVALASAASDSAQPIAVFFMGIVLTIIWPKFGREKLRKKEVLVHLIATALVVAGIVMVQG